MQLMITGRACNGGDQYLLLSQTDWIIASDIAYCFDCTAARPASTGPNWNVVAIIDKCWVCRHVFLIYIASLHPRPGICRVTCRRYCVDGKSAVEVGGNLQSGRSSTAGDRRQDQVTRYRRDWVDLFTDAS